MTVFISMVAIVIGLALWFYTNRAAFYRRNQAGIEVFDSYGQMHARRIAERLIRIAAVIMILAGIGHLILPTFDHGDRTIGANYALSAAHRG